MNKRTVIFLDHTHRLSSRPIHVEPQVLKWGVLTIIDLQNWPLRSISTNIKIRQKYHLSDWHQGEKTSLCQIKHNIWAASSAIFCVACNKTVLLWLKYKKNAHTVNNVIIRWQLVFNAHVFQVSFPDVTIATDVYSQKYSIFAVISSNGKPLQLSFNFLNKIIKFSRPIQTKFKICYCYSRSKM